MSKNRAPLMHDWDWDMIQARTDIHTITFRYPKMFRKAVAVSLGRGDQLPATLTETEEFIREAVKANIAALMTDMLGIPSERPKPASSQSSRLTARRAKTNGRLFIKKRTSTSGS